MRLVLAFRTVQNLVGNEVMKWAVHSTCQTKGQGFCRCRHNLLISTTLLIFLSTTLAAKLEKNENLMEFVKSLESLYIKMVECDIDDQGSCSTYPWP